MKLPFHPSARENFDKKAVELHSLVVEAADLQGDAPTFPSELPIAGEISTKDMIGEVESGEVDYKGRTVSRYFIFNNLRYGLVGSAYAQLIALAEKIQRHQNIGDQVSLDSLEKWIFRWLKENFRKELPLPSCCDYLAGIAGSTIQKITTWTPIAFLEVEHSFEIGNVEIRPITSQVIEGWVQALPSTPDQTSLKNSVLTHLKGNFQGLAAAVMRVDAEPARATERALEEAQLAVSLLGKFSAGALLPDVRCPCTVARDRITPATSVVLDTGDMGFHTDESLPDPSSRFWRIGQEDIKGFRIRGLETINALIKSSNLSDFAQRILSAIQIYSRCAFTSAPVEKLIYIFSAMESMLVRNESEPIQQNIGDRLAFCIGKTLEERKKIVQSVKQVYAMRSKFVHHGKTHSDLEVLREFLGYAATFFDNLPLNREKFRTKDEFLNAADDMKLS